MFWQIAQDKRAAIENGSVSIPGGATYRADTGNQNLRIVVKVSVTLPQRKYFGMEPIANNCTQELIFDFSAACHLYSKTTLTN
jgi:hypothetical protein